MSARRTTGRRRDGRGDDVTAGARGSLDKAYEGTVTDFEWAFWQYSLLNDCARIPAAAAATDQKLFDTIDKVVPFAGYDDRDLANYTPYFYQAGTELGSPDVKQPHLDGLRRYGTIPLRDLVPRDIPMPFKPGAMRDIDAWVRGGARQMMFVNGQNDPWSAEPFRLGKGARDSRTRRRLSRWRRPTRRSTAVTSSVSRRCTRRRAKGARRRSARAGTGCHTTAGTCYSAICS